MCGTKHRMLNSYSFMRVGLGFGLHILWALHAQEPAA